MQTGWGTWVVQSVKPQTSAQVMISQFEIHIRPCAYSSQRGACFGLYVSLSLPLPHLFSLCLCLSLSQENK